MKCEYCGYEFDEDCGRYGCPNCFGEGLDMAEENGESRRKMQVRDTIEAQIEAIRVRIDARQSATEADVAVIETLRWVVGDSQLPEPTDA